MSASGTATPLTLSDIPCESCGLYFRLDGDLIDHRASEHTESPLVSCGFCGAWCRPGVPHEAWEGVDEMCLWPIPTPPNIDPPKEQR